MSRSTYHHGDLKNALIEAGTQVLAEKGVAGLSLRAVARRAGVSHAAPYAHFADKQALIAAISTEGYRRVYEQLEAVLERYPSEPLRQLVEAGWTYVQFATADPARFRTTFSGAVEKQKDYPAYVEMSQKSFALVVRIVQACQAEGILAEGASEQMAVSVWSLVHGLVALQVEGQLSHELADPTRLRAQLLFALGQMARVEIDPERFRLPALK